MTKSQGSRSSQFARDVRELLLASNWHEGRRVDTAVFRSYLQKRGYRVSAAAKEFLDEFCGLTIVRRRGRQRSDERFGPQSMLSRACIARGFAFRWLDKRIPDGTHANTVLEHEVGEDCCYVGSGLSRTHTFVVADGRLLYVNAGWECGIFYSDLNHFLDVWWIGKGESEDVGSIGFDWESYPESLQRVLENLRDEAEFHWPP